MHLNHDLVCLTFIVVVTIVVVVVECLITKTWVEMLVEIRQVTDFALKWRLVCFLILRSI